MTTKSLFYFLSIKHCVLPSTFSQPCWQVGMGVVEADGESSPLSCFVSSSYKTSFPSPFIIIGQYQMLEYGKNIIKEGFGLVQTLQSIGKRSRCPDRVGLIWSPCAVVLFGHQPYARWVKWGHVMVHWINFDLISSKFVPALKLGGKGWKSVDWTNLGCGGHLGSPANASAGSLAAPGVTGEWRTWGAAGCK